MNLDFSKLVTLEIFKLKDLYSELLENDGFELVSFDIGEIIFRNDNGCELSFIYDTNRYIAGNHMLLCDIKVSDGISSYALEDLIILKRPTFEMRSYLDKERRKGNSRKRAYKSLISDVLQNTVEFDKF
jgi:hypothetical protein